MNETDVAVYPIDARGQLIPAHLILALCFTIFFTARNALHLPLPQLQTLAFIALVFSGQGTVYLVRERCHSWDSRPSRWMLVSSAADIMLVSPLAAHGILMAAVSTRLLAGVLLAVRLYLIAVDFAKVRIFAYVNLHSSVRRFLQCSLGFQE